MPESSEIQNPAASPSLGEALVAKGLLERSDLERALELEKERGGGLARILADLGFVNPAELLKVQSERLGLPVARAGEFPVEPLHEHQIPASYMRHYRFLPLGGSPVLRVAVADPLDLATLASIQSLTGMPVEVALASETEILRGIDAIYGQTMPADPAPSARADMDRLRDMASEAPVIRYVNALIAQALDESASDIHLEPFESAFRVRFRIDGVLEERSAPASKLEAAVVSRLKLMAKLDIAERRLPQDGRIQLKALGREIDVRVATLPTLYGESLALRLLDPAVADELDLASLGFDGDLLARIERIAALPHGLLLVTGPTGSGKSTTLHAALKRVNSAQRKIITIEDPVEYRLAGVNQIHVAPAIGLTFATGLRHIVRQDPDVIMVGEIRDRETAEIAVRAALTGHCVYSTLHTNDAASAITRLSDMGVERYLLASSVTAVLAQRLVRVLCQQCKRPSAVAESPGGDQVQSWEPVGCEACRGQGYRGRLGIFELLEVNAAVRRAIATNVDMSEASCHGNLRSLQQDAWAKVRQGLTSVAEVVRATQDA